MCVHDEQRVRGRAQHAGRRAQIRRDGSRSGTGHRLGPPTPHIFGGLLDYLSKPNLGIGARSSKYLQAMDSAMGQVAVGDVLMMVCQCRIVKCCDST